MSSSAKIRPWYRKQDGWWYVTHRIHGRRVQTKLVEGQKNEAEAYQRFYELMAVHGDVEEPCSPQISFNELCQRFLVWSKAKNASSTTKWYHGFLADFDEHYDGPVRRLRKQHVEGWLVHHPDWGQSTQRQAITCIKRVLNWGFDEGLILEIPVGIRGLRRPAMTRRETLIDDKTHDEILKATDQAFGVFVRALRETGARPDEVRRVTASDVDLENGVWVLKDHKTAEKTGRVRLIYLTDRMIELTSQLMETHADGPLFRNSVGKPWTSNAVRCRMRRLRQKLNLEVGVVAYAYRHTYATEGLSQGVGIAEMAELLGHADTKMLSSHYAHLDQKVGLMRKAAEQAGAES